MGVRVAFTATAKSQAMKLPHLAADVVFMTLTLNTHQISSFSIPFYCNNEVMIKLCGFFGHSKLYIYFYFDSILDL